MITLATLFANKYLVAALVALGGGIYLYIKGYLAGKEREQDRQAATIEQIENDIRKAESKNIQTERQRAEDEKKVHAADSIGSLIGLWSALSKKDPSDKTGKNK